MEKCHSYESYRTGITYEVFRDGDWLLHKCRRGPNYFAESRVKIPDSEKETAELLKKIDEILALIPPEIKKQKDLIRQGNAAIKNKQIKKAKRLLSDAKKPDMNAEFLIEKANVYDFAVKLRLARLETKRDSLQARIRANRKVWDRKTEKPRIEKIIIKP